MFTCNNCSRQTFIGCDHIKIGTTHTSHKTITLVIFIQCSRQLSQALGYNQVRIKYKWSIYCFGLLRSYSIYEVPIYCLSSLSAYAKVVAIQIYFFLSSHIFYYYHIVALSDCCIHKSVLNKSSPYQLAFPLLVLN